MVTGWCDTPEQISCCHCCESKGKGPSFEPGATHTHTNTARCAMIDCWSEHLQAASIISDTLHRMLTFTFSRREHNNKLFMISLSLSLSLPLYLYIRLCPFVPLYHPTTRHTPPFISNRIVFVRPP